MNVNEALRVEKLVNRESGFAPYAEYRAESVSPRAKIGDFSQIFERMTLLLQGIIGRGRPFNLYVFGFYFKRLSRLGSQNERTRNDKGRAYVLTGDFVVVFYFLAFKDHLNVFKATAIVEFDKPERLGVSERFDPARDDDLLTAVFFGIGKNLFKINSVLHILVSVIYSTTDIF